MQASRGKGAMLAGFPAAHGRAATAKTEKRRKRERERETESIFNARYCSCSVTLPPF